MELITENPCMRLYLHRNEGIVHHEILRELESAMFRDILTRGAELVEQGLATKWLSDDRGHIYLSETDEHWARSSWFPRAKAAGWKYWAIVKPKSAIGSLNIARVSQKYSDMGVAATIVTDVPEALRWLRAFGGFQRPEGQAR